LVHEELLLRTGRVHLEDGRLDEARGYLQRVAATPCTDMICGLAWMFLGEVEEREAAFDAAISAYTQAAAVLAVRHSALLAMLRVAQVHAPGTAVALTSQFETGSVLDREDDADGWARYLRGQPMRLASFLDTLRAEVRR
jgi:hypothetical protein